MACLYEYEILFDLINENTKEQSVLTRREWAYNVMDAATQGILNAQRAAGSSSVEIKIAHIGPPQDLISQYAKVAQSEIERMLARIKS